MLVVAGNPFARVFYGFPRAPGWGGPKEKRGRRFSTWPREPAGGGWREETIVCGAPLPLRPYREFKLLPAGSAAYKQVPTAAGVIALSGVAGWKLTHKQVPNAAERTAFFRRHRLEAGTYKRVLGADDSVHFSGATGQRPSL